jgi:hypothetical protein
MGRPHRVGESVTAVQIAVPRCTLLCASQDERQQRHRPAVETRFLETRRECGPRLRMTNIYPVLASAPSIIATAFGTP